jgi:hypothetical protein
MVLPDETPIREVEQVTLSRKRQRAATAVVDEIDPVNHYPKVFWIGGPAPFVIQQRIHVRDGRGPLAFDNGRVIVRDEEQEARLRAAYASGRWGQIWENDPGFTQVCPGCGWKCGSQGAWNWHASYAHPQGVMGEHIDDYPNYYEIARGT